VCDSTACMTWWHTRLTSGDVTAAAFYEEWCRHVALKSSIHYLHFSKSGGTAMCAHARANDCATPTALPGGKNCIDDGAADGPHWLDLSANPQIWNPQFYNAQLHPKTFRHEAMDACGWRVQRTHHGTLPYSFFSNENFLPGGHTGTVCNEFVNVIILREPIARIFSLWAHFHRMRQPRSGPWPGTPEGLVNLSHAVADNHFVRYLLGRRGYALPLGGVTREHYLEAKQQLAKFDLVFTLDMMAPNCTAAFRFGLGWNRSAAFPRPGKLHSYSYLRGYAAQEAHLRWLNVWDLRLFDLASSLSQQCCAAFEAIAAAAAAGDTTVRSRFAEHHSARWAHCHPTPLYLSSQAGVRHRRRHGTASHNATHGYSMSISNRSVSP
jgi:hypothetical protein